MLASVLLVDLTSPHRLSAWGQTWSYSSPHSNGEPGPRPGITWFIRKPHTRAAVVIMFTHQIPETRMDRRSIWRVVGRSLGIENRNRLLSSIYNNVDVSRTSTSFLSCAGHCVLGLDTINSDILKWSVSGAEGATKSGRGINTGIPTKCAEEHWFYFFKLAMATQIVCDNHNNTTK